MHFILWILDLKINEPNKRSRKIKQKIQFKTISFLFSLIFFQIRLERFFFELHNLTFGNRISLLNDKGKTKKKNICLFQSKKFNSISWLVKVKKLEVKWPINQWASDRLQQEAGNSLILNNLSKSICLYTIVPLLNRGKESSFTSEQTDNLPIKIHSSRRSTTATPADLHPTTSTSTESTKKKRKCHNQQQTEKGK